MSKLSVDANEAAALVARLLGGTLALKDNGMTITLPSLDVTLDARSLAFEGTVQKGPLKIDVHKIAVAASGVTVDFELK